MVFVIEDLAEIVDAREDLVGDARRKDGVPRNGIVRNVDGRDLIVILQLGGRFRQRRAANRGDLVALPYRSSERRGCSYR
jgi:hypothetical protein